MSKKRRVVNSGRRHMSTEEDAKLRHGFQGFFMSIVVETSPTGDLLQKSISENKVNRDKENFKPMPNYRSVVQFWPQGGGELLVRKLKEEGSGVRAVGKKRPAPPAEKDDSKKDDSEEDSDSSPTSVSISLVAVLSAIDAN